MGLYVVFGLLAATVLQMLIVLPLVDWEVARVADITTAPETMPGGRWTLLVVQGVSAACIFLLAPWLYLKQHERRKVSSLSPRSVPPEALLLAAAVTIVALPANAFFIEWNEAIRLPPAVEAWARGQEDSRAVLTEYLTTFAGPGQLLLALVVIAVVPALGEELLFRGLLQPQLARRVGPHVSIWLVALIFSAFHFQPYGLVPRTLLGALFGYLYYWSGNLWAPITAHFANNAFTLLMVYLYRSGVSDLDLESSDGTPLLYSALSLGLVVAGLFYFRKTVSPRV
ncbi:MAG: CPBP family intramembrane glutamic endopeptidase [Catalinimonas sp.]